MLTEKILRFGDLGIPLFKLIWIEEAHHTLANLSPAGHKFFADISLRDIRMLLHVIAQPSSSILESSLQFFLLIRAEVQIRCESLHFRSDLITYFWCQIHHILLLLAHLAILDRGLEY